MRKIKNIALVNRVIIFILCFVCGSPLLSQQTNSDEFLIATKAVPKLAFELTELKVNPPVSLEGISAVAADSKGNIYVLHRPSNGDPVVVIDSKGNFLRSWGKGMFTIPHGIRLDKIRKCLDG